MRQVEIAGSPVVRGRSGAHRRRARLESLKAAYGPPTGRTSFSEALCLNEFPGRVAAASSFGSKSSGAVLMALVDTGRTRTYPVLFLRPAFCFPQTLAYADQLGQRLGLRDVRFLSPRARSSAAARSRPRPLDQRSRSMLLHSQGAAFPHGVATIRLLDLRLEARPRRCSRRCRDAGAGGRDRSRQNPLALWSNRGYRREPSAIGTFPGIRS